MSAAHEQQPPSVPPGDGEAASIPWAADVPPAHDFDNRVPPPPPPRVEEVEARPISRAETRGPAIEVPGVRHTSEPPPASTMGAQQAAPSGAVPPGHAPGGVPFGAVPPGAVPPMPPPTNPAPARAPSKFWVVVCHLAYLIPTAIPGLALTLLIWAWRRKRDPHLDDQAREALNFQLTYAGLHLILIGTCVLCLLVPVVWIVGAVLCVVAAVQAADGQRYRYPWILRLIK